MRDAKAEIMNRVRRVRRVALAASVLLLGACATTPSATTISPRTMAMAARPLPPSNRTAAAPAPVPTAAVASASPPVPVADPYAGCAAVDGAVTLPSGRSMIVRAAATTHPRPAVLVLHGYTGSPASAEADSELTPSALADGMLVAYPQGSPLPSGGSAWNSGAGLYASTTGDDVDVLAGMIDALIASYCVEPRDVVLSGESNGAGMIIRAGCSAAVNHRISALVAVIPAVDPAVIAPCADAGLRPVPLLAVAAEHDLTVPYAGLIPLLGQVAWFTSVARQLDQCSSVVAEPAGDSSASSLSGQRCTATAALVSVPSGEHRWPHADAGFDTSAAVLALAASAA
jgi:polyhydroxybutyrate depolymerase